MRKPEKIDPQPALIDREGRKLGPGPVYQGVNKTIRALTESGHLDQQRDAAISAAARSLARSIDRASGHGGFRVEGGHAIAALHTQLVATLAALTGSGTNENDPFDDLLASLSDPADAQA
jgi:hypothetical protein|nr:MAG TPA: hypothetical protein [Caudoviricetes sp.]